MNTHVAADGYQVSVGNVGCEFIQRILRLYIVCIVLLLISSDEFWLPV